MKVFSVLVPSGFFGDESGDMVEAASLRIEGNRPYACCTKDVRGGMCTDAMEVFRPFPEVGRRSFGYAKERAVMRLVYKLVMFLCGRGVGGVRAAGVVGCAGAYRPPGESGVQWLRLLRGCAWCCWW